MPLSVSLPSPSIEWLQYYYHPCLVSSGGLPGASSGLWDGLGMRQAPAKHRLIGDTGGEANNYTGYGNVFTVGGTVQLRNQLDRPCIRVTSNGDNGDGFLPPNFSPVFNAPGGAFAPGARQDPGAVVTVFDLHASVTLVGAAPAFVNDTCPFMFFPDGTLGAHLGQLPPGGAGPHLRGFGVFLNTVAAVAAYEYVSWDDAGAVLDRVTIGSAIVPSVADWNTFRFIVTSSRSSGESAALTLRVNGFDVLVGRAFGSTTLLDPTGAPQAAGLFVASNWKAGGDTLFYSLSAKSGRFTPAGQELQGE